MKKLFLATLFLLLGVQFGHAQDEVAVDTTAVLAEAQELSLAWLHLIDNIEYRASWDNASEAFKAAVTPDQWNAALLQARGSIHKPDNRTVVSSQYAKDPPNAPPGEYVVQIFTFSGGGQSYTETLSMMKDSDGVWRAGGYFIRPN